MSLDRAAELARLGEQRDQALRDILALEQQVALGEIPLAAAQRLRRGYERSAAQALGDAGTEPAPGPLQAPRRTRRGRVIAYLLAVSVAVLAAAVVLPRYIGARPANGFVTGNEPMQGLTTNSTQRSPTASATAPGPTSISPTDPASLTALAAAVAANPDDDTARLALANGYTEHGDYDNATPQYRSLLQRNPANAEARAHYSWLLLQTGQPRQALAMVRQALAQDPTSLDGQWFLANIQLYGLDAAGDALTTLRHLQQRSDLPAARRGEITALTAVAARLAGQR